MPHAPSWPYELLISPRGHVPDLPAAGPRLRQGLAVILVDALTRLERLLGRDAPYMLWFHQRPNNQDDHRAYYPAAHLHAHLAPALRAPGTHRHLAAAEFGGRRVLRPGRSAAGRGPVAIRVTPPGPPDAADGFAENYDREPTGVWFAPGRVNLMGGPDYTEGFVLPFALGSQASPSRRLAEKTAASPWYRGSKEPSP